MAAESSFWRLLRTNLEGHIVRIENAISAGSPDVNACHNGVEVWLELKAAPRFTDIYFRVSQLAWTIRRVSKGGNVKLVYKVRNTIGILDGNLLVEHKESLRPTTNQTVYVPLYKIEHEKFEKPYDWKRINEIIYQPGKERKKDVKSVRS